MATVTHVLDPLGARIFSTAAPALLVQSNGTNFPVAGYSFTNATTCSIYFVFDAVSYGSGNLTVLVDCYTAATSGVVNFQAQIACVTPTSDTASILGKAFATATAGQFTAAATANRLFQASITVSNLDSIAAGDWVCLRLFRQAGTAPDTATSPAVVLGVTVSYSD